MRSWLSVTASVAAFTVVPAHGLQLLTHGKTAVFRDKADDSALIRFGRNRALAQLIDPTCTGVHPSAVKVSAYESNVVVTHVDVPLACDKWRPARGGFLYEDAGGPVRRIVYTSRKLVVQLKGFPPITGPVGYVELWLTLGDERLLGRFHDFRRNEAAHIVARKPSTSAAEGEAAFWDVLWGDDDSEGRQNVALHCLTKAAKASRKDGRSRFLLGMMLLYRFGHSTPDARVASEAARADVAAAQEAFDAALPLLWNGQAGDSRVPGFAAAAKYVNGIAHGDVALVADGLADLDASVAVNPLFNLFDFVGVVAPVIRPTDPLYAKVIQTVDFALAPDNLACLTEQPEICGNDGMAPHNLEGALVLFGDLYAKGLVQDDPSPFRGADNLYRLANVFAQAGDWNARFKTLAAERQATVAERVALYGNDDPADDPLLIGNGPGETCATCHHKR